MTHIPQVAQPSPIRHGVKMQLFIDASVVEVSEDIADWAMANYPRVEGLPDLPGDETGLVLNRFPAAVKKEGLFRTFAEAEPTVKGMRKFWDKFGDPDAKLADICSDADGTTVFVMKTVLDDLFHGRHLLREHREMQLCVRVLDLIDKHRTQPAHTGHHRELALHVRWDTTQAGISVSFREDPSAKGTGILIASEKTQPELLRRLKPGDLVAPALLYLQQTISRHLREKVVPRLLFHADGSRLSLHFVPLTLLGSLWLQLASAVSSGVRYRKCGGCGCWFEVSKEKARKDKQYCEPACRTRAYRSRQGHGN